MPELGGDGAVVGVGVEGAISDGGGDMAAFGDGVASGGEVFGGWPELGDGDGDGESGVLDFGGGEGEAAGGEEDFDWTVTESF